MSSLRGHTRRGVKARRTTYQPVGRMSPTDIHQEPHYKPSRNQGSPKKTRGATQAALVSPNRTWADAVRVTGANTVAIRHPTFHTVAKDVGFPYPFAANPHLLITGRYSGNTDNNHELVFRHVFPAGHAATKELLQSCRTLMRLETPSHSSRRRQRNKKGSGHSHATYGFAFQAQGQQRQPMSNNVYNTTTRTRKRVAC
jgi:hypothetical protein